MLAQAVPVAVDEPGRAHHGAGLVTRPEGGEEAAPELVAVLLEDAGKLQDAGIAGGVVGRLGAGPGVLVSADHDEVLATALDLPDGDLHGAPAVLDVGAEPHAHGSRLQHLAQLQAGGAGDADTGQRRHLGSIGLGRRVAPHGLHRAERHGRVLRMPPVHHHAARRAHDRGDALLLVAGRVVGELRERDLARGVAPLVLAEGAGGHVHQLGGDAVGERRQAVAQRVGLDRQLDGRYDAHLGLVGKAHQPRHLVHARRHPGLSQRRGAVFGHALAVFGAGEARWNLRRDVLDVGPDVGHRDRLNDTLIRHARPSLPPCAGPALAKVGILRQSSGRVTSG